MKKKGLFIVCTTRSNASPTYLIEILSRICKVPSLPPLKSFPSLSLPLQVIKDFCGVLTEDAIRKNFILIYELLDEMIDYGHP